MTRESGIYKIVNIINGKFYIGSTQNLYQRFHVHNSMLKKGSHQNIHLQRSFNKHGKDAFIFEVIMKCPVEYTIKLEQWFIDNLKPSYNILPIAGTTRGRITTEEAKEKQSKSRRKLLDSGYVQIGYAKPRFIYDIYENNKVVFTGKSDEIVKEFKGNKSTFYCAFHRDNLWMKKYKIVKLKIR